MEDRGRDGGGGRADSGPRVVGDAATRGAEAKLAEMTELYRLAQLRIAALEKLIEALVIREKE